MSGENLGHVCVLPKTWMIVMCKGGQHWPKVLQRRHFFFFCNCIHLTHLLKPSVTEARSLGDTEVNTAYLLSSWIQHSMATISKSQHLLQVLEQIYYLAGRESLVMGLYSVNSLYVNVKCIHLFY